MTATTDPTRSRPTGRRRGVRWFTVTALVAGGLAAAGMAWQARAPGQAAVTAAPAAPPAARPFELAAVEVARVAPRTLEERVRLSGSIRPLEQTSLKSEVAARLTEVLVREGEAVRKGQVLARFDTVELAARLREKEANLQGARAQLDYAEKTRAKNATLRQKQIVAETSFDQALSAAQAQQAAVAALEAQVALARKSLRDAVVTSPIDGMVAERAVQPGENLAVNAKLFTVVDLSRVEVEATVPAETVARLAPGQPVTVAVDGFGDRRFTGTIARINPVAQTGSRAIPVYIAIDNPDGSLRGGMFAVGEALVDRADGATAVPADALRHDGEGDFVLVVDNGRLERRGVSVVRTWARGDMVQVTGLPPGLTVVTAPLPGLKAGHTVTVTATAG